MYRRMLLPLMKQRQENEPVCFPGQLFEELNRVEVFSSHSPPDLRRQNPCVGRPCGRLCGQRAVSRLQIPGGHNHA